MIEVAITKPYRFVPPYKGDFWLWFMNKYLPHYIRGTWGVEWPTVHGLDSLRASIAAGHGVILAANHPRPCDPFVIGAINSEIERYFYIMSSWHLFADSRIQTWILRRVGAFSLFREGLDREAIKTAADLLVEARRPLIVFPEGRISRANDSLGELMDGVAFIARTAAKARARATPSGQVVIHPLTLRYTFAGDLRQAVEPVLHTIEQRLGWFPHSGRTLVERVRLLGEALLSIKEVEYFGSAQPGPRSERVLRLIERVLGPLEARYVGGERDSKIATRVKKVRCAVLPELKRNEGTEEELTQRRRHLLECSFAQLLDLYPGGYIEGEPSVERLLETVERFEEDLADNARIHRPLHCRIDIDEPLSVSPDRPRGQPDPLTTQLEERLKAMLASTTHLCHPWKE